jgi:hypothetical protein
MSKKLQKIIKADLLASNEHVYDTYSDLYERKIQEIQRDFELKFNRCEANSTYDKTMKHWMLDLDPGDDAKYENFYPIEAMPGPIWKAVIQGTKEERERHKAQVIAKWRAQALEKDGIVLKSIPFSKVLCPKCKALMKYDWSIMYDRGTFEDSDERVLHVYICPKCPQKEAIFEDGIRWATNSGNRCSFCQSVRTTTVTKDEDNNIFLIHRCLRCKEMQIEEEV